MEQVYQLFLVFLPMARAIIDIPPLSKGERIP
jgi:hypothetical protein